MKFTKNMSEVTVETGMPEAGGYILKCIKSESKKSKAGNDMLELELEPIWSDSEGHLMAGRFKFNLKTYTVFADDAGLSRLKGVLTAFQHSNPTKLTEKDVNGDSFDENRLVSLQIGAVLREEEYLNNKNEPRIGLKVFYLCSTQSIAEKKYKVPPCKTLETGHKQADNQAADQKEIPF